MTKRLPRTVAELIELWPSAEQFSDDLGLKYRSHGRLMKVRGSIPRNRWDSVVQAATSRGIDGVTHRLLERLHIAKYLEEVRRSAREVA